MGAWAAFPHREREVKGLGRSLEDPTYQGRTGEAEASLSCVQTGSHPLGVEELEGWGGEVSGELGNSGADACKAQWYV